MHLIGAYFLSPAGILDITVAGNEKYAASTSAVSVNLFKKRDLLALMRGDPPEDNQVDEQQLALL